MAAALGAVLAPSVMGINESSDIPYQSEQVVLDDIVQSTSLRIKGQRDDKEIAWITDKLREGLRPNVIDISPNAPFSISETGTN